MSGKYKLTYFNARGRAEIIRLVLVAANEDFEDNRITREQWPELKPNTPTGSLPFLETPDGKKMTQSMAIARSLAKKFDLYADNDQEIYLIERTIGQITDIFDELYKMYFSPEEKKEEMKKTFAECSGKKHIQTIQTFLDESEGGYFAGKRVTIADLVFLSCMDYLRQTFSTLLDESPKLNQHYDAVLQALPRVADWIKKRPETPM